MTTESRANRYREAAGGEQDPPGNQAAKSDRSANGPTSAYDAVVIGSGFGGTILALEIAKKFKERGRGERLLVLERGTWWLSPEQPAKRMREFLRREGRPHQFWPRPDHASGIRTMISATRSAANPWGLYDYRILGNVHVLVSSGVGGGSLVYANVTVPPPDEVFDEWPVSLEAHQVNSDVMRLLIAEAINFIHVNKIATKQTGFGDPSRPDDGWLLERSKVFRDASTQAPSRFTMKHEFADLSIIEGPSPSRGVSGPARDFTLGGPPPLPDPPDPRIDPSGFDEWKAQHAARIDEWKRFAKVRTFCERQGRCVLGCLPGARQTLNKKLFERMRRTSIATDFFDPASTRRETIPNEDALPIEVAELCEARAIEPLRQGTVGYRVRYRNHYLGRDEAVITNTLCLCAGTLGTTELLLRSKRFGGLVNLSDRLGERFSVNGDFLGFVRPTRFLVNAARGPNTTSHIMFYRAGRFRFTIEDGGIPRMWARPITRMVETAKVLRSSRRLWRTFRHPLYSRAMRRPARALRWSIRVARPRMRGPEATVDPDESPTEDGLVSHTFFFACMGRDRGNGKLRLRAGRLALDWIVLPGMTHPDRPNILQDPIFEEIQEGMRDLAEYFMDPRHPDAFAGHPFWDVLGKARTVVSVHPIGGCPMGEDVDRGVVDSLGRVFDKSRRGKSPDARFYPNLYVADGSIVPSPLGVNPSLTIAALSFRIAGKVVDTLGQS